MSAQEKVIAFSAPAHEYKMRQSGPTKEEILKKQNELLMQQEKILIEIEALKILYGEIFLLGKSNESDIIDIQQTICYRKKPYGFPRVQ